MKHVFTLALIAIGITVAAQTRQASPSNSRTAPNPVGFDITEFTSESMVAIDSLIVGGCVEVSNFEVHGDFRALGVFSDSVQATSLTSGLVMTSGRAIGALGPDDANGNGSNNNDAGHPFLNTLAGINTYDANWIEFDFTPLADTLFACEFVFGSEEYPEYVNGGFNDVFGFFISGPGISGTFNGAENIAWIPNTTTPVSIDNINNGFSQTEPSTGPCSNCQYYIDNSNGPYLQYDGYTTPIYLQYPVVAGESYHFVIAIADAGDGILDSGVFLQSQSFCGNTWFQTSEFVAQPQGGNSFQFQNTSQRADSYLWDFGDGQYSIEENPTHTYATPGDYDVALTSTNTCFDTTATMLLNVGTITNINDQVEIETTITYPNLEHVRLTCSLNNAAPVSYSVIDIGGRTLSSRELGISFNFTENIDVSALATGVYFLQLQAGKTVETVKFVKI